MQLGADVQRSGAAGVRRQHISERAAVPKAIHIHALPVTAVGKTFKPALSLREIEDALAEALLSANLSFDTLKALSDRAHGTVVEVGLAESADPQRAQAVLGQFPFRFRLSAGRD